MSAGAISSQTKVMGRSRPQSGNHHKYNGWWGGQASTDDIIENIEEGAKDETASTTKDPEKLADYVESSMSGRKIDFRLCFNASTNKQITSHSQALKYVRCKTA